MRASHARRGSGAAPARAGQPAPVTVPIDPQAAPITPLRLLRVQQTAGNAAATAVVQRQPTGQVTPATRPTLRYGSTGEDVKVLQMKLQKVREREHDRDAQGARIDGIFGPLTRQDVTAFQEDTGLEADGVVGPRTWHALDSLVTGTPDEGVERALNVQFAEGLALEDAGRYDEAMLAFEAIVAVSTTPEMAVTARANIGACHHQRGRFGLAVASYEAALGARFNQETIRAAILRDLELARRNAFRPTPPPDPEPLPPGADAATAATREGGGVTAREPAKSGDTGAAVDLFKGKLAHMMVGWPPKLPAGDNFDAPTIEKTRAFQGASGLEQTGEADAATWHALDSFTKADVPFSVLRPHWDRNAEATRLGRTDPAASLPLLEANRDEALALGLTEDAKDAEAQIGRAHHQLSHFAEAVAHYELYLGRVIPSPGQYGYVLELLRRARAGLPFE